MASTCSREISMLQSPLVASQINASLLAIPVSSSSILPLSICQSVVAEWSSVLDSCSIVAVVKSLHAAQFSVTRRSSPVASIPSTPVSSRCRLSLAGSLLSRALLSEMTSESEHHAWRKSRIRRSHTGASLGSYENGSFVSRSVGRE